MPHSEKLLQRETLGKNRVFTHERWHVRLENGRTAECEIIRHPGGVGIVAVDENDRLLMVRQYRSGMGHESLEIPAGKRDAGEVPEVCGRRELEEETGYQADEFISLGKMLPTCAYDEEVIHMYLARGLHKTHQHLDEDEFLDVEPIPFQKLVDMVLANEIEDGKTQIMILKLKLLKDMGKL